MFPRVDHAKRSPWIRFIKRSSTLESSCGRGCNLCKLIRAKILAARPDAALVHEINIKLKLDLEDNPALLTLSIGVDPDSTSRKDDQKSGGPASRMVWLKVGVKKTFWVIMVSLKPDQMSMFLFLIQNSRYHLTPVLKTEWD